LLLTVLIGSPIALFHIDRERNRAEVSTRSGTTIFTDGQGRHRAIIDDQSQVFLLGNDRPDRRLGRIAGAQFGRVRQLFFSPQDRWLATAGEEHTARLWDLETLEEHLAFPDRVHRVVFSADGRLATVLDATTSAAIWEVTKSPWWNSPSGTPTVSRLRYRWSTAGR
jgi:WD40 repeat protein